jgi:hypothetical protein
MTPRASVWTRWLVAVTLGSLACLAGPRRALAAGAPSPMRRIAVLVGANDAPAGRAPLRFAHTDAQQVADALVRVGRFAPSDVRVLLDPTPAALGDALAGAAAVARAGDGNTLFLFYYSGHSDGASLFPHGQAVGIGAVRDAIEHVAARIRIGILDTCRGGSWTQAKGLTVGPPLDVPDLIDASTEGTALVSSSSGFENAHEAEALNGSFFTHHFVAGLLGAADRSGDGSITLEEAFDYAKERTVRDSARLASVPQHPSFDLQLRGRQDIVLTTISSSPSALEVRPTATTLEVIHLPSGITIAEVPPATRPVRVAVAPARYLVRSVIAGRVHAEEFDVRPGETVSIADGQLEATGDDRLAMKGEEPPARQPPIADASTPPQGHGVWQLLAGESEVTLSGVSVVGGSGSQVEGLTTRSFATSGSFNYGITDRLSWTLPGGLSYRFGTAGHAEVVVSAGVTSVGYAAALGLIVNPSADVKVRLWTAPGQSLILGAYASFPTFVQTESGPSPDTNLAKFLANGGSIGYAATIGDVVTLHLAAAVTGYEPVVPTGWRTPGVTLFLGSFQSIGFQDLPLVQVHVSRRFSLDAYTQWAFTPSTNRFGDSYLAGFTFAY